MMAQAFSPSLGKRVRAMLRLACRVLGLKRRKGLGLALLGAMAAALMGGAPAQAANGIHINANASGPCVSINDPQSVYIVGGSTDVYLRENVNFTDNAVRCNPVSGADQYGYILFSPRVDVTGVGATSLTLGGQLSVNSGFIKLGDDTTGQRIGNWSTTADPLGLSIGNSAQAQKWGVGLGMLARATGAEAAMAAGNNTQASASYSTVLGVASNVSALHGSALGPSSVIRGEYAVGVGRFAQTTADNAIAFGRSSTAVTVDSVAIGTSANGADGSAIALGSGSQTRAAVAPQGVLLLGVSPAFSATHLDGVGSVGSAIRNRQVINVAPGAVHAQSTDAVNGAQLFAAYDAINILGATDQAQQAAMARNAAGLAAARGEQAATSASFARAVGGGATVDAQNRVVMPGPAASAGGAAEPPATVLGAVTALDRGINQQDEMLGETFDQGMALMDKADRVASPLLGLGPDETVAGRIDDVKKALLMWDPVRGVYTATTVPDEQRRISNLAAGQAATDAVNKGQLDQAITALQDSSLVRESDGQLRVGQDSSATSVNLAGSAPRRDADGNPVVGADGQPETAAVDRQVTGVAAGVNANDAVNKGQLDGVAQAAAAAQGAAGDAR